jgi:hypothetical protein
MYLHSAAFIIGAAVAAAAPEPAAPNPTAFCSTVNKVITAVHAQSAATAFCSSYLHVSATTITVTGTATSLPSDYPCYQNSGTKRDEEAAAAALEKRGQAKPVPTPSCFKGYNAGKALSSACSCLSIPSGTSTTTAAATVTNFAIQADTNGQYAALNDQSRGEGADDDLVYGFVTTDLLQAEVFTLDGGESCRLRFAANSVASLIGQDGGFYGADPFVSVAYADTFVYCHVTRGTLELVCSGADGAVSTVDGENGDNWRLGDGSAGTETGLTALFWSGVGSHRCPSCTGSS